MTSLLIGDLPPHLQERVVCSISAAAKYQVPANVILAIAEKEGGRPGQWKSNRNGTHDVGPMQFNTSYLSDLARFGIAADDVAAGGCYSFDLAGWRLRQHMQKDVGDLWTRAANYHSRTPRYNIVYRADLMHKAKKWAEWLDFQFVTYDLLEPAAIQTAVVSRQEAKPEVIHSMQRNRSIRASNTYPRDTKARYVPRMLINMLLESK